MKQKILASKEQKSGKFYILKSNNINVTIRKEFGGNVDAACGQLRAKAKEEWSYADILYDRCRKSKNT